MGLLDKANAATSAQERQGQYITREWLSNLASGVDLSIYYDWKEDGTSPTDPESHFGTVRPDLTPKPAFGAVRDLIAGLRGYTFRHRLEKYDPKIWQLLFQRGDSGDLALVTWKAGSGASASEQTPTLRKIMSGDADYQPLRHLAGIHFAYGPLAATGATGATLRLTCRNDGDSRAAVVAEVWDGSITDVPESRKSVDMASHTKAELALGVWRADLPADPELCQLHLFWNGVRLPDVSPIVVQRTDPRFLTATPYRGKLRVAIENPAGTPFAGIVWLMKHPPAHQQPPITPVVLKKGETTAYATLPLPPQDQLVEIGLSPNHPPTYDKYHPVVAYTSLQRFVPMVGFSSTAADSAPHSDTFTERIWWRTLPRPIDLSLISSEPAVMRPPMSRSISATTSRRAGSTPK